MTGRPATRAKGGSASRGSARGGAGQSRAVRSGGLRVRREGRNEDDGYRNELVAGVRSLADAERLAAEIAFAAGRLLTLGTEPPSIYGEVRALAPGDIETATWMCFLIAYLSPLASDDDDAFVSIRAALAAVPRIEIARTQELSAPLDFEALELGPRTSHQPGRGVATLLAYAQWVQRTGGEEGQRAAFEGDPGWTPERRFARVFERIALPGFGRQGRYELLTLLGRVGLYEMHADALLLSGGAVNSGEGTMLAAKRVFGIGDPILLERRAVALADACSVPVEALDLALFNWASPERATDGFPAAVSDADVESLARLALEL
ncbi:MAG TPA: hypothetical protein VH025_11865 [Solirubrobacteraceae bacterium]|nr:hypothetical protein [Solirubrobacteraceae bacterium]